MSFSPPLLGLRARLASMEIESSVASRTWQIYLVPKSISFSSKKRLSKIKGVVEEEVDWCLQRPRPISPRAL